MSDSPGSSDSSTAIRDATALVQALGQSLNMATLYGIHHKVSRTSLEGSYPVLTLFTTIYGHLDINVTEGSLLINGNPSEAPLAGLLASKLTAHNLLSFEIVKGFTLDEYLALFSLLLAPPSQPGASITAKLNESSGFSHIQARSIEYRRVAEGEAAPPSSPDLPPAPPSGGTTSQPPDLDNILAFLKDDQGANPRRVTEDIRQLAGDTDKLAELVLRSVEIRASASTIAGGESLTDIVVGAIGKIVHELSSPETIRTEKGRKQVKRSLMLLEKTILQKLQHIAGPETAAAAETLLDEAAENLDMENLASKYLKNRKASEESSGKLRRLIARTGNDPEQLETLRESLVSRGLSEEGWQELIITREAGNVTSEAPPSEGLADIKALTLLLARLGETIDHAHAESASEELRGMAQETHRKIEALSSTTARKISSLRQMLGQETLDASGKPTPLPRRQLMEFLAEIAQELSQPLTVVSASLDMLRAQRAGVLTEAQGELLNMAAGSADRLAHLVSCLIRIAGNPDSTHPDKTVLDVLYNTPPPPDRFTA